MTVVAVVSILASIVIVAVDRIRSSSRNAECQSNLRQIGAAILIYTNDHAGRLPGGNLNENQAGLAASQPAYVRLNDWNRLAPHVAPYLSHDLPDDANERALFPMFVCPGVALHYPEIVTEPYAAIYLLNPHNQLPGDTNSRAFGNSSGSPRTPSLHIYEIPDPSGTYMLSDIDKQSEGGGSWTYEAEAPVHGTTRNQVFFDGHVEAVPLSKRL